LRNRSDGRPGANNSIDAGLILHHQPFFSSAAGAWQYFFAHSSPLKTLGMRKKHRGRGKPTQPPQHAATSAPSPGLAARWIDWQ
jgi:hypothetical protein